MRVRISIAPLFEALIISQETKSTFHCFNLSGGQAYANQSIRKFVMQYAQIIFPKV